MAQRSKHDYCYHCGRRRLTSDDLRKGALILETLATMWCTTVSALTGRRWSLKGMERWSLKDKRHVAIAVMSRATAFSAEQVGGFFDGRKHPSIARSITIADPVKVDAATGVVLEALQARSGAA